MEMPVNDPSKITLHASVAPAINLAMQQNASPVIRELCLESTSEEDLEELVVTLTADPGFLRKKIWNIDRLLAGTSLQLSQLNVELVPELLAGTREASRGALSFRVTQGEKTLAELNLPNRLLAFNEWGGINDIPEMLAAFVQPNQPEVDGILRQASHLLREATGDGSLDGYQSGSPRRVATAVEALYRVVAARRLTYANPPAHFEQSGQKVRLADNVLETGLGSCLDLTLLLCACLEQAGLNPVVIVLDGHTFPGVWLQEEDFSSATTDDVQAVRKRVDLGELLIFESTLLTRTPTPLLRFAREEAKRQIAAPEAGGAKPATFQLAVDIKRARMAGIRPLSLANEPGGGAAAAEEPGEPTATGLGQDLDDIAEVAEDVPAGAAFDPSDRLLKWQRRLLDLSLRNKLLNFKPSKKTIRPVCFDPGRLEDLLADGKAFKLIPVPQTMAQDQRDFSLYREQHGEDAVKAYVNQRLEKGELIFERDKEELAGALTEIYRSARAALADGGANELYLALGFLEWRAEDKGGKICKAPLILVPVILTRKSVKSGFMLEIHEEDPRFNPTLLEMLRQDFDLELHALGGLLPTDEHGLDVAGIWRRVREAVRDIAGWEVREEIVISAFSFAKHLMWHDLVVQTDTLRENRAVAHLLDTPKDGYAREGDPDPVRPEDIDVAFPPHKTFCPLPADSSQMAAIMNAARGRDFVLIGPPGTGKSQTIANLIAQCLAEDKKVLFVSEKTAALDVVYRRLKAIGLGPFCLELHSHKSRKAEVLAQLDVAWTTRQQLDDSAWERECARLQAHREALNATVTHLHRRHGNGWSAFYAIGTLINHAEVPRVDLVWPGHEAHTEDQYLELEDIAKRLDLNRQQLGDIAGHPLAEVAQAEWSPSWQTSFIQQAGHLAQAAQGLGQALEGYLQALSLPLDGLAYEQIHGLDDLQQLLAEADELPLLWTFTKQRKTISDAIARAVETIGQFRAAWQRLSVPYRRDVLTLDLTDLADTFHSFDDTWFLKKALGQRKVVKALRAHTEGKETPVDVAGDLEALKAAKTAFDLAGRLGQLIAPACPAWDGVDTDSAALTTPVEWSKRYRKVLSRLSPDQAVLTDINRVLAKLIQDADMMLGEDSALMARGAQFHAALETYRGQLEAIAALAAAQVEKLVDTRQPGYLSRVQGTAQHWQGMERQLKIWCAWQSAKRDAIHAGLAPVVDLFEAGHNLGYDGLTVLKTNYARWWINALVDVDEVLRKFVPAEHEQTVREFAELDQRHRALTVEYIQTKLGKGIPSKQQVGKDSEWAILQRELAKKSRHMAVREMVSKMPAALTALTPCVMMSPLSIAQYLPPDTTPFDVVVFDEASQIAPWDAIGAFARGNQVIVVGDPKQLPPTSFFDRRTDDEADDSVGVEDMESILDECMAANLPTQDLRWHYRSACESLIAFSNARYYDGRLVTFPSPATEERAVRFHHVPGGVYDRGGSRTNRGEADALVAHIVDLLRQPDFRDSVGVVTFNSEQQRLIEDLFDKVRAEHPQIEPHFAEDYAESVFVKNLESVQGDERDHIFFSIGYGPDKDGKVTMNFGPINQAGGPRRLNVAVTRARRSLHVFATLKAEMIDLGRSDKEGVRDLKHFLEYGERGLVQARHEGVSRGGFDSPFEEAVFRSLEAKGWRLVTQVGVSDYRVDIGVVHPDAPGKFLAAIECDGATYHRSASARDRDLLREQVLRRLGWEVIRIWSLDWWTDSEAALVRVDSRLREFLETERALEQSDKHLVKSRGQVGANAEGLIDGDGR